MVHITEVVQEKIPVLGLGQAPQGVHHGVHGKHGFCRRPGADISQPHGKELGKLIFQPAFPQGGLNTGKDLFRIFRIVILERIVQHMGVCLTAGAENPDPGAKTAQCRQNQQGADGQSGGLLNDILLDLADVENAELSVGTTGPDQQSNQGPHTKKQEDRSHHPR